MNWDKELDEEAEKQRRRKKEVSKSNVSQAPLPPVKKPEVVPQLPKPRSSVSPKPNRISNSGGGGGTLDLLGLGMISIPHLFLIRTKISIWKFFLRQVQLKIQPAQMVQTIFSPHFSQLRHRVRLTMMLQTQRPVQVAQQQNPKKRAFSIKQFPLLKKRAK